jgi:hypothetical protein
MMKEQVVRQVVAVWRANGVLRSTVSHYLWWVAKFRNRPIQPSVARRRGRSGRDEDAHRASGDRRGRRFAAVGEVTAAGEAAASR